MMRMLQRSGVWEFGQEAEDEFREPVNVLAAQESLFDDSDLHSQDVGPGAGNDASSPVGSSVPLSEGAAGSRQVAGGAAASGGAAEGRNEAGVISLDCSSDDDSWLG